MGGGGEWLIHMRVWVGGGTRVGYYVSFFLLVLLFSHVPSVLSE